MAMSQPFSSSFPSPTPSPESVVAFKTLFSKRFGVDLGEEEAGKLATRYLHIFYFGVTPPHCQNSDAGTNLSALKPPSVNPPSLNLTLPLCAQPSMPAAPPVTATNGKSNPSKTKSAL